MNLIRCNSATLISVKLGDVSCGFMSHDVLGPKQAETSGAVGAGCASGDLGPVNAALLSPQPPL